MPFDGSASVGGAHLLLLARAFMRLNQMETSRDAKRRTTERLCGSPSLNLRGGAACTGTLERQSDVGQQMFDGAKEA
jgi:hypothetical protein